MEIWILAYLLRIIALKCLEHMLTCIRVVKERVSLGSVYKLEVLCARLAKDGLLGSHSGP